MKKYISDYMDNVDKFINKELDSASKERISRFLREFETKIAYFQHERLIHLIVTVLFAILEIVSIYAMFLGTSFVAIVLSFMFLVLLIPYVMHYYFLENSVQKMYLKRDTIIVKLESLSDSE